METNDRNDGLARWHAQRRDGFGPYAGGSAQSGGEELQRGTLAGSRAMVMPSKKHGINVMLERALELSPRWADAARGFQGVVPFVVELRVADFLSPLRSRLCYATSAITPSGGPIASRAPSKRCRSR